jgi:hypothetical protein
MLNSTRAAWLVSAGIAIPLVAGPEVRAGSPAREEYRYDYFLVRHVGRGGPFSATTVTELVGRGAAPQQASIQPSPGRVGPT